VLYLTACRPRRAKIEDEPAGCYKYLKRLGNIFSMATSSLYVGGGWLLCVPKGHGRYCWGVEGGRATRKYAMTRSPMGIRAGTVAGA
jgi:hypothetical protein